MGLCQLRAYFYSAGAFISYRTNGILIQWLQDYSSGQVTNMSVTKNHSNKVTTLTCILMITIDSQLIVFQVQMIGFKIILSTKTINSKDNLHPPLDFPNHMSSLAGSLWNCHYSKKTTKHKLGDAVNTNSNCIVLFACLLCWYSINQHFYSNTTFLISKIICLMPEKSKTRSK